MHIISGNYTAIGCTDNNTARMKNAFRKSSEKYRKRRKVIRGAKKGQSRPKKRKKETCMNMEASRCFLGRYFVYIRIYT